MKEIELTQGYVTYVDDEDYEELIKYKWCVVTTSGAPRAVRHSRREEKGKSHTIYMHRQIMDAPSNMDVHHRDHDTLNNQKKNLRVCTRSQNLANRRKRAGCSSRFKGVYWDKDNKKWRAQIRIDGSMQHLGYFYDEVKAARAYNVEAKKKWGEFALLNDV